MPAGLRFGRAVHAPPSRPGLPSKGIKATLKYTFCSTAPQTPILAGGDIGIGLRLGSSKNEQAGVGAACRLVVEAGTFDFRRF